MNPQPFHIIGHIDNACNLKCIYCYTKSPAQKQKVVESNYELIIKRINESSVKVLSIIGGEPLLVKELPNLVSKLRKDIYINIESNITLIKDKWDESYKKENVSFSTTIDGPNKEIHNKTRGLFSKTIEGIKFLHDKGIEVRVNVVVNKYNYRYLNQTLNLLADMGVRRVCLGKVRYFEFPGKKNFLLSREEYEEVVPEVLKIWQKNKRLSVSLNGWYDSRLFKKGYSYKPACFCGAYRVTIDWRAKCYPCELMVFYKSPFCEQVGSLESSSIKGIMDKNKLFQKFREVTFHHLPLSCENCAFKDLCNHGCRYVAYLSSGTLFGKNIHCKVKKSDIYDVLGLDYYLPDSEYAIARYSGELANFLKDNIESIVKPLDIGCGAGLWTFFLAKLGKKILGIDPRKEMVGLAKYYLAKEDEKVRQKITFYNCSLKDFNLKNTKSALILGNTLGHFSYDEFEKVIEKLRQNKINNILLDYMDLSELIFDSPIEFEWCGHQLKESYERLSENSFHREIKNLDNGLEVELEGDIWTREKVEGLLNKYDYKLKKEVHKKNKIIQLWK